MAATKRSNGEGYIAFEKARNRWRGALAWTDPDGTARRKAFSGPTRGAVAARIAALRAELADGRRPASTRSLASYLAGWLEAERSQVRPATWMAREGHIRRYIVPAIGHVRLGKLTPAHVEAMTDGMLERGLSARTAASCRTSLSKALRDALRGGLVDRNVASLARPPRIPGREVEYLDRDELRRLLDACEGEPIGPLVILAATTGLRQGELIGLGWADVDLAAATLTVRRSMARGMDGQHLAEPKTSRSRRTLHLPEMATDALKAQAAAQAATKAATGGDWQDVDGLIFTDVLGRPMTSSHIGHVWHPLLRSTGLRSVPFHCLRHSWATLALAQGVPLKVVADNLGHASIAVTAAFYSGIVPELNRDAAEAIGRALGAER